MSDRTENEAMSLGAGLRAAAFVRGARWLPERLLAERDRWPLWIPVGFGVGIGAYFSLPAEPHLLAGSAVFLASATVWAWTRRAHGIAAFAALGVAVAAAGFAVAQARTYWVAAPVLVEEHGPVSLSGMVLDVEPRPTGTRVVFAVKEVPGLDAARAPERVRVSIRTKGIEPAPGMVARVRAVLLPPPEPAAPGAFDFGRAL